MNYKETLEYLEEVKAYGSVLGLTSMKELMRRLNNPQDKYQVIHLAGTNGKGSTQAYITSMFMQTREIVGHYTSPVVFQEMEMIQINQKMIAKKTYAKYVSLIRQISLKMVEDGFSHPTLFEINTAIAFLYFYDRKCSMVIIETGLGGREDATNVITKSKICVFTAISMDHMEYIGNTIEKIAKEKAGIITKGSHVVIGTNPPEVKQILRDKAKEEEAHISEVKVEDIIRIKETIFEQIFSYKELNKLKIHMAGAYQVENATLAIMCVKAYNSLQVSEEKIIKETSIYDGLSQAKWFGRFSVIDKSPLFIVDGAHNVEASKRLQESVNLYFTNKNIIYIIGIFKDKEYNKMMKETVPYAKHVITVTTPNKKRSLPAYQLASELKEEHSMVTAADSIEEAVEIAYLLAGKDTVIVAFGSLSYLARITDVVQNKKVIKLDTHGI